jgi:putative thioredoxin
MELAEMADSPWVADVTQATFKQLVLEKSKEIPVLVDFWAPWCGPCRMLTPILTKLANDYGGKFFLAKINTDSEQQLAGEYQIRGIPAVKLYRDGKVAGEFVGVQPESAVRALIERFLPKESENALRQATALAQQGQIADAVALLRAAVANDPRDDQVKIELVRLLLRTTATAAARRDEAEKLLDSLSFERTSDPVVEGLRTKLDFLRAVENAPPLGVLENAVATNPDNTEARYQLSAHKALADDYEPAIQQLLEIVNRDRSYGDDAARKALVGLFGLLGNDPRVPKYRALLSRALH